MTRLGYQIPNFTYPGRSNKDIFTTVVTFGHRSTHNEGEAVWFELEHDALGFEFGTFTGRFEKLEEALRIIVPLLQGQRVSMSSKYYSVNDAVNSPTPISRIPIMIGGIGEKKTLGMVAQYADESNLSSCTIPQIPHKIEVLNEHCERLGRNRSEITVSRMMNVCVAPTTEQAEADLREIADVKGWNNDIVEMARKWLIFGDPDTVGERLVEALNAGLDGLTINLPANGHIPDRVALCGQVANVGVDVVVAV